MKSEMTAKMKRAVLSWLLVFAMMVGLMPMIAGNEYAASSEEDGWNYCDALPSSVQSDQYIIEYNN